MARMKTRHGVLMTVAVAVTALVAATGLTGCRPAEAWDRPILLVHGWNALGGGSDCAANFGSLERSLRDQGFTGDIVTVAFYDSDRNCDVDLADFGSISNSTSWRNLSKVFSTFVYETYTQHGVTVDAVGHSMGGLIIRGAVLGSSRGEAGFAPPIRVEDAVTLAAPHAGAAWYSNLCFWGQCSGLKPGNGDLNWLNEVGDPQGLNTTEWTIYGSSNDGVVPLESALNMGIADDRRVALSGIGHSDYSSDPAVQALVGEALARVDV